jgi:hypothetical protein
MNLNIRNFYCLKDLRHTLSFRAIYFKVTDTEKTIIVMNSILSEYLKNCSLISLITILYLT